MKTLLISFLTVSVCATLFFTPPTYMSPAMILEKLSKEDKRKYEQADEFFQTEKYLQALDIYKELMASYPEDLYFKYRAGICYLYKPDEREKAIPLLETVETSAPEFLEAKFYLGRAYHYSLRFEEAATKISAFARGSNLEGEDIDIVQRYIAYCNHGKEIIKQKSNWEVKNMGPEINTEGSEYVPLLSPKEDLLYFTYKGEESTGGVQDVNKKRNPKGTFYEDIFFSEYKNGKWTKPENLSEQINGVEHEAALAISIDGQRLFIYKSGNNGGKDIYMSKLNGSEWSEPKKLEGGVNSKHWEGSACLSSNGQTLYFSSDRPGGYGGRDLYSANLFPDGTWGNVKNLGATVNSEWDEDGPFMHADNKTLYFSSNGHKTMGESDIFFTKLEDFGWTVPENLGYPISTPDDDRYFIISMDGKRGYFSSQIAGGYGLHDLYLAYDLRDGDPTVLAYINAKIQLDGQPVEAQIKMIDNNTGEPYGLHNSNSITGFAKMIVNQGENLRIEVNIPGRTDVPTLIDTVDATELEKYIEMDHTFNLYTEEYLLLTGIDVSEEGSLYVKVANEIRKEKGLPLLLTKEELALAETEANLDKPSETVELAEQKENPEINEQAIAATEELVGPCGGPLYIDFAYFEGKDLNDSLIYNQLMEMGGNYCAEGLHFEVQIGAYQFPLNFKYPHLRTFGAAQIRDYPDKITRFSMGSFSNMKEAETLRQRIIKAGQFDAWLTPFYKGKRHLMEEMIAVDFYGKAIN